MKITTYKCDLCKVVFDNTEKVVGIGFGSAETRNQRFAVCAENECLGHVCCNCVEIAKRLFDSRKPKQVKE